MLKLTVTGIATIHLDPTEDGAISGECKAVQILASSGTTGHGDGDNPLTIEQRPLEWSGLVQAHLTPLSPSPKVATPGYSAAHKMRSCNTAHALAAELGDPLRLQYGSALT